MSNKHRDVPDLSGRGGTEQQLRLWIERYRSLIAATAQVVWTANPQGEAVGDAPAWRALTGQTEEEIRGRGWLSAIHPEDRERSAALWSRAVETRSIYDTEYRVRTRSGEYRHFSARGVPVLEADGSIREWVGTCTDITERKQAEAELRRHREHLEASAHERTRQLEASDARYHTIFNQVDDAIFVCELPEAGPPGNFLEVNDVACEWLGYSREELLAMSPPDITSPESPAIHAERVDRLRRNGRARFDTIHIAKGGQSIPVEVYAHRVEWGGEVLAVSVVRDITARRQVESICRARSDVLEHLSAGGSLQDLLDALVAHAMAIFPDHPASVLLLDDKGRLHNGASTGLPDFYEAAIEGLEIGPDVGSCGAAAFLGQRVIVDDIATHPNWARFVGLARRANLGACWSEPIKGSTGSVLGTFAVYGQHPQAPDSSDLQLLSDSARLAGLAIERKRTEAALAQQEEFNGLLLRTIPFGMTIVDEQCNLLFMNDRLKERVGEGALGRPCYSVLRDDGTQCEQCPMRRPADPGATVECEVAGVLGGRTFRITHTGMARQGRTAVLEMFEDITEHREAEREYRAIIQTALDGFWIVDQQGRLLDVNDAYCKMTGYTREQLLGMRITDVEASESAEETVRHVRRVMQSGFDRFESRHRRSDGALIDVEVSVQTATVRGGAMVAFVTDITARKRAEVTLIEALETSEHRRTEVAALLEGSRAVLNERDFARAARSIFDSCKRLIGADAGYMALTTGNGTGNDVLLLDSGGRTCSVDPELPMPIRGFRGEVYSTGQTASHNAFPSSPWAALLPPGHSPVDNVLFAPLIVEGRVAGLLGLANKPGGVRRE